MANNIKTNPVSLDTFAADVEIAPANENFQISSIVFTSTAADTCVLVDGAGNIVHVSRLPVANGTDEQHPMVTAKGLTFDLSASTIGGTANVLIYSK
ncbi:MAG: hypothetical protein ACW987_08955 [Candidatus Thorarchaeota archaeon]|jgi:hypothetical protein